MRIAYILYDDITLLDFVGFYDPLARLRSQGFIADLTWDLCALTPTIRDNFGMEIRMNRVKPDLSVYDLIYVPGGFGSRQLQGDPEFIDWLKTAADVPRKVSVCTGSLLLGAAGFLVGKRATTHFNEYSALRPYAMSVSEADIVEDGDVITGGAVAASLDLGLYVCERLAGKEATTAIAKSMNYRGATNTSPIIDSEPGPPSSR